LGSAEILAKNSVITTGWESAREKKLNFSTLNLNENCIEITFVNAPEFAACGELTWGPRQDGALVTRIGITDGSLEALPFKGCMNEPQSALRSSRK